MCFLCVLRVILYLHSQSEKPYSAYRYAHQTRFVVRTISDGTWKRRPGRNCYFLADRTDGRTYATVLRPSVVCRLSSVCQ